MSIASNAGLQTMSPYTKFGGFENALKGDQPIWVTNNSKPRSLLIMTVTDPLSGRVKTLEFYNTMIPFCLTDMLPRGVIEQSLELRTFIMKGILKIVPEAEAHAILASDKGKKEYERLVTSEFAQGGKGSDRVDAMESQHKTAQEQAMASLSTTSVSVAAPVHAKLLGWESRCVAGDLDGSALSSELDIYADEFTQADCTWMLTSLMPQEAKDFAAAKMRSGNFAAAAPLQSSQNSKVVAQDYDGGFDVE